MKHLLIVFTAAICCLQSVFAQTSLDFGIAATSGGRHKELLDANGEISIYLNATNASGFEPRILLGFEGGFHGSTLKNNAVSLSSLVLLIMGLDIGLASYVEESQSNIISEEIPVRVLVKGVTTQAVYEELRTKDPSFQHLGDVKISEWKTFPEPDLN